PEPNGPNLLRLERALRADHASGVPGPPLPDRRVELRMSHFVLLLAGLARSRVHSLQSAGVLSCTAIEGWVVWRPSGYGRFLTKSRHVRDRPDRWDCH